MAEATAGLSSTIWDSAAEPYNVFSPPRHFTGESLSFDAVLGSTPLSGAAASSALRSPFHVGAEAGILRHIAEPERSVSDFDRSSSGGSDTSEGDENRPAVA